MTSQNSEQPNGTDTYYLACWLFLRLVGLCFLFAFTSAFFQVDGLIGSDGIMPIQATLEEYRRTIGASAWLGKPSLFWLNSSDALLNGVVAGGIALSIAIICGLFSGPCLLLAFIAYGSLLHVGSDFFAFQWDALLLETGLLAVFLMPWRHCEPPLAAGSYSYSRLVVWLVRWLMFRVMFCSGAVKLLSGCVLWRDGTALNYYYQNQLLPNPLAWYAHQMPPWVQEFSLVAGLVLELVVPFCIFAPRQWRLAGALSIMALQAMMALTGNHGFINFLTIVLCLPLLDDAFLKPVVPKALAARFQFVELAAPKIKAARCLGCALIGALLVVTTIQFAQTLGANPIFPQFLKRWMSGLRAYHITGSYGLYPLVYTDRTELVLEGSNDLKDWRPYEFKFKIGDVGRAPPLVAPLQPRLDWRMRFAVLTRPGECVWFGPFVDKLLAGSPPVLQLLDKNPFPDHPPAYIRASVYRYAFTNPAQRSTTGNWWTRQLLNSYMDPTSLK